jgi:hypothetical protein
MRLLSWQTQISRTYVGTTGGTRMISMEDIGKLFSAGIYYFVCGILIFVGAFLAGLGWKLGSQK